MFSLVYEDKSVSSFDLYIYPIETFIWLSLDLSIKSDRKLLLHADFASCANFKPRLNVPPAPTSF
jgi:hypothetical protein